MSKVKETAFGSGIYQHYCPGCKTIHYINTTTKNHAGAQWNFNGDRNNPSFSPSINLKKGKYADPNYTDEYSLSAICHYFIKSGRIEFCGDSTHEMKGQTIEMEAVEKYLQ